MSFVLRSSLIQSLVVGLVFAPGSTHIAPVSAALITLVALWIGFVCARLVTRRRKLTFVNSILLTMIAGSVLGSVSAFVFCLIIEFYPVFGGVGFYALLPFLLFGAWVGAALALMNVRAWRNRGLV